MTPPPLDELRALLAKATPGDWWFTGATIRANKPYTPEFGESGSVVTRITYGYDGSTKQRAIDYGLIVAFRNHGEALLDEIERLRGVLAPFAKLLTDIERIEADMGYGSNSEDITVPRVLFIGARAALSGGEA